MKPVLCMEMTLLYVYMKEFIQYLSYIKTQFKFFWNHLETKALPFCIHEVKVLIFFLKKEVWSHIQGIPPSMCFL